MGVTQAVSVGFPKFPKFCIENGVILCRKGGGLLKTRNNMWNCKKLSMPLMYIAEIFSFGIFWGWGVEIAARLQQTCRKIGASML
jgi:hypothetical protein